MIEDDGVELTLSNMSPGCHTRKLNGVRDRWDKTPTPNKNQHQQQLLQVETGCPKTRPGCFCAKDCLESVEMYTWWNTFTCTGGGGLYWPALCCTGLYWAVLGWTGLYWAALGCTGLYLAVLEFSGLYLAALGCTGLNWAVVDCTGMYWAVLGCTGMYWAPLGCNEL